MIDVESTLDAIRILRDIDAYMQCEPIGRDIRARAYLRLERELKNYLTGTK